MSYSNYSTRTAIPFKKIITVTLSVIAALILICCSFYTVDSTERGIIKTLGKISEEPVAAGLHVKIPFVQTVYKMSIQTYKVEGVEASYTKDIQSADIAIVLNYDVIPDSVACLYTKIGTKYAEKIIFPIVKGVIKDVIGEFNAAEIVENRENVRKQIESNLKQQVPSKYFTNISFQITNIDYDDAFESAIIAKQVAEQEALKAKNTTVRIEEEAKQKVIAAEAEAQAMKVRADALVKNPKLTEYEAVMKWDGKLPTYMMGGTVPFINLN